MAIDVIRATTTAVTAVALGRRCFAAPSIDAAVTLAAKLERPLLVGELGGNMPYGFDLTNSPAAIAELADVSRPMVLVSSSGTQLICEAGAATAAYVGSLRGYSALVDHLSREDAVAVIGAGTRGQFREEDQLCCAWIADGLLARGFRAETAETQRVVERWRGAEPAAIAGSESAAYLRRTGQLHDLEFILAHVDDLGDVFAVDGDEVVRVER